MPRRAPKQNRPPDPPAPSEAPTVRRSQETPPTHQHHPSLSGDRFPLALPVRIASVGECMVELSQLANPDKRVLMGTAGDTLNTAVYLARSLIPRGEATVSYATVVGADPLSRNMTAAIASEGIDQRLIGIDPHRLPGLYAIEVSPDGERRFHFWRSRSAARRLFSLPLPSMDSLRGYTMVYLSGITLAILPTRVRQQLIDACAEWKRNGTIIAFDSNYRPQLWSTPKETRKWIAAMWRSTTVGFPSRDDEARLYPGETVAQTCARIGEAGVGEVVLKDGAKGPHLWHNGRMMAVRRNYPQTIQPVDTTGAGDAFNAGYLAARIRGQDIPQAAWDGHELARKVIAYPGAIIPKNAMLPGAMEKRPRDPR